MYKTFITSTGSVCLLASLFICFLGIFVPDLQKKNTIKQKKH